jgi:hypothetical protein
MLPQNSRYRKTPILELGPSPTCSFAGTRPRDVRTLSGAIEHRIQRGERLDLLALHYYGDSSRWWLILDANPDLLDASDFESEARVGTVVVIPAGEAQEGR